MNERINSGEPLTKVVGKRRMPTAGSPASIKRFDALQSLTGRLMNGMPYPKGVHRFRTEEEFEAWRMNLMIKNSPARRAAKTSSESAAN